ncbi:MAG: sigma-70 family RNA polymerase sigma factor [Planctomycetota bacterium]
MQATDHFSQNPLAGPGAAKRLAARVASLGREIPSTTREPVLALLAQDDLDPEALRDVLSTRLMEAFRDHRSRACFGLLYELNGSHLLGQVAGRLRRYSSQADPGDVLQEVFFNVYRYPHRFDSSRDDAFRVWSAMIVRNTVLKHLRSLGRGGRQEVPFEDLGDQPLADDTSPLAGVLQEEESRACSRAYVTYLQLYLRFYGMLSERERRALHLVEVDRVSYREAADELEVKLENLKMVIFRARRKIHRSMRRVFEGLPPDCRPARGVDFQSDARGGVEETSR